jgi:hypothetical protein
MVVKVKKNKTPKQKQISKGKRENQRLSLQNQQSVSQNVKVNIYKPERKYFKIKQLGRDKEVPNIRQLPMSSFHITQHQPSPLLYQEKFGDARPVHVGRFEQALARMAVNDNRQAEVASLSNGLESSKLKKIEREPIQAPSFRGETEEQHFMARARASNDNYTNPFRITARQQAGTIGVSFRDRLQEQDYVREARLARFATPEHIAELKEPPNTVLSTLERARDEGLTGEAQPINESPTFRDGDLGGEAQFEDASVEQTHQEDIDRKHTMPLGEPSIPNRLFTYAAEQGTTGDVLGEQRGEYFEPVQGQAELEAHDEEVKDYSAQTRHNKVKRFLKQQQEKKAKAAIRELHENAIFRQEVRRGTEDALGAYEAQRLVEYGDKKSSKA